MPKTIRSIYTDPNVMPIVKVAAGRRRLRWRLMGIVLPDQKPRSDEYCRNHASHYPSIWYTPARPI